MWDLGEAEAEADSFVPIYVPILAADREPIEVIYQSVKTHRRGDEHARVKYAYV